ncbi:hypothetical protein GMRT_14528 [Giardia muris]|uniref:Uncharacterized protein n=1 Tax=Giardia muris TaxID=5742 RepID=A0A4Z1T048_GIAMU|nr:hypothetical protein GMRT_14528 [Giardia muris]|eukprot:TNJ29078.1 hypothetical protein GMRT_14528 [Giardia muris]
MTRQFRFVQADPDEFDDLNDFDVDYASAYTDVVSKYTPLAAVEQPLPNTTSDKRRKKRRAASQIPSKTSSNTQLLDQDFPGAEQQRSASAYHPDSSQIPTVENQQKARRRRRKAVEQLPGIVEEVTEPVIELQPTDNEEKRTRRRKVKRKGDAYTSDPTPGPLRADGHETPLTPPSAPHSEAPANPYKQAPRQSNPFATSLSPIGEKSQGRVSSSGQGSMRVDTLDPYAASTPGLPAEPSVCADVEDYTGQINRSVIGSLALELSEQNRSMAREISYDLSNVVQSPHSSSGKPLQQASSMGDLNLDLTGASGVSGGETCAKSLLQHSLHRSLVSGDSRSRLNSSSNARPHPLQTSTYNSQYRDESSDEKEALLSRVKQLEDEKRQAQLREIEREKQQMEQEISQLNAKIEQERSMLFDVSLRMQTSTVGQPSVEPASPEAGTHPKLHAESLCQVTREHVSKADETRATEPTKREDSANLPSSVSTSPRMPPPRRKAKSHGRRKYVLSSSISSNSDSGSDDDRYYYSRRRHQRSKTDIDVLFDTVRSMEAQQRKLFRRLEELATETHTVRNVGVNVTNDAVDSTTHPSAMPVGVTYGYPTPGSSMFMPMASFVPQMPIQTVQMPPHMPYPMYVAIPPQFPQYQQCTAPPAMSSETSALITAVSRAMCPGSVRPSVAETMRSMMAAYGFGTQ